MWWWCLVELVLIFLGVLMCIAKGGGTNNVDEDGDAGLQNVVKYLRRTKEIAETEISLLKQMKFRLQAELDSAIETAETSQASLRAERANSRALLCTDEEFKSLQLQGLEWKKKAEKLEIELQQCYKAQSRLSEQLVVELDELRALKSLLKKEDLIASLQNDCSQSRDMIENVLEIHVREVMTPLARVRAIDAGATLLDFHKFWVTQPYSRVPVFEKHIYNIVGIFYAVDLLDYLQKGEVLETTSVGDIADKPAYFVPDSMSIWNLLEEFRIRKVHMAVVLNKRRGTAGIVTLEDVVEEVVGAIVDENDNKEGNEILRKRIKALRKKLVKREQGLAGNSSRNVDEDKHAAVAVDAV